MRSSGLRNTKSARVSATTPQLDQISPSHYINDEDALEAGTELEEKAERFAIGYKAQKYYDLSLALYNRAIALNGRNQDAPYNAARVCFILATSFLVPPKSIEVLNQSALLYRQSLQMSSPLEVSDGSPSAFYLDMQFNRAVTLLALADQLEQGKEPADIRGRIIEEAVQHFESVIDGQEAVLQQQKVYEQQDEHATGADTDTRDSNMGENGHMDDDQARSEYTTSLITPSAALETLHNLHLAGLAAIDAAKDESSVDQSIELSLSSTRRANIIVGAFTDGEARSPDGEWFENVESFRYAEMDVRIAEISKKGSMGMANQHDFQETVTATAKETMQHANALISAEGMSNTNHSSTKERAASRIHLQQVEHLGDLLLTLARLQIAILYNESPDASLTQSIWNTLGLSSKLYLAVLKALDTTADNAGSSAVLGSSNASTAMTRRRCSLYTALSTVPMLRSDSVLLQHMSTVDQNTRQQLVNNGRIYARRAVSEIGLGWLLNVNDAANVQYELPHGGFDSLQGEAEAILTLLRALYIRSTVIDSASSSQEAEVICHNLKHGLLRGSHSASWNWILFHPQGTSGGRGLLDQIIAEEGLKSVSEHEQSFWAQVETKLLS